VNDGSLQVRGITVRFGGLTALDDVSLTAAPRQVTGIIGPNGAGKTTLLNVLCGFVRPDTGTIHFAGRDLTQLRPHRLAGLGIARTLQGAGLFRALSVLENVMVGATPLARAGFWSALLGLPRSDSDERWLRGLALQALDRVAVADLADSMPDALAHGPRKRVALARALVAQPRLLLLDEPASGLSEAELPELGDLISKLAEDTAVVVIEHRMDLMMSVCDTIFVLDFGKVIAAGSPEQVQSDPAVTAAYLGAELPGEQRSQAAGREEAALVVVGEVVAVDRDPGQTRSVDALGRERFPAIAVGDREVVAGDVDGALVVADTAEPAIAKKQRRRGRRRDEIDDDAPLGQQAARREVHQRVADLRRFGMEPDRALPSRIDATDKQWLLPARCELGAAAQHPPGELEDALLGEEMLVVRGHRRTDRLRHGAPRQRFERAERRGRPRRHRLSRGRRPIK